MIIIISIFFSQTFCSSLSPPAYVIEVQSQAENDWLLELSRFFGILGFHRPKLQRKHMIHNKTTSQTNWNMIQQNMYIIQ